MRFTNLSRLSIVKSISSKVCGIDCIWSLFRSNTLTLRVHTNFYYVFDLLVTCRIRGFILFITTYYSLTLVLTWPSKFLRRWLSTCMIMFTCAYWSTTCIFAHVYTSVYILFPVLLIDLVRWGLRTIHFVHHCSWLVSWKRTWRFSMIRNFSHDFICN